MSKNLLILLLTLTSCKLYDEPILLLRTESPFNKTKVIIYKSLSSATVERNIHVKTIFDKIEKVKCSFGYYDTVKAHYFKQDTLFLSLEDSEKMFESQLVYCIIN
jgi:hypothetical protein